MVIFYQLIKYAWGGFGASSPAAEQNDAVAHTSAAAAAGRAALPSRRAAPMWRPGAEFDFRVFLSLGPEADSVRFDAPEDSLLWEERALSLDWDESNTRERNVSAIPEWALGELQRNGSVFAHAFLTRPGAAFDPDDAAYDELACAHKAEQLNVHMPRPKVVAHKNLISGEYGDERLDSSMSDEEIEGVVGAPVDIVNMWRPALSVRVLLDFSTHKNPAAVPDPIGRVFRFHPETGRYWPPVHYDYFWLLDERFVIVNETVDALPLEMSFSPVSLIKLQLQMQMEESWKAQGTESDSMQFKRMLMDTNPWLLGLTFFVSVAHMVLDFFTFKNDVQFWRDGKDRTGMSVRTIMANCVMQLIVFLYLMDSESTSWMILMSAGVGVVIEAWKLTKAADVSRTSTFPFVRVDDKAASVASGVAEYDRDAMRYLSWALYPIVVCYSVYSLVYDQYKGWYSWLIGSLVGSVYMFGFLAMVPQVILNYKLKSVAHMPMRSLAFKFLNTVIDDLFSFIIPMPTLHRLACFRDDVVFLIYMYQFYTYRVDMTRTNEFGATFVEPIEREEVLEKLGAHPRIMRLVAEYAGEAAAAPAAKEAEAGAKATPKQKPAEEEEGEGEEAAVPASDENVPRRRNKGKKSRRED